MSSEGTVFVDATNAIAGRLASSVAKLLLTGKRVVVVNAERALISGEKGSVILAWKKKLELSSRVNPIYGPIHPRRPDNILKRMVRGMVPRKKTKGDEAMKRLRIYIGVPEAVKMKKFIELEASKAPRPQPVYVTMAELSKSLGWSG